jgi:hypothetical protein
LSFDGVSREARDRTSKLLLNGGSDGLDAHLAVTCSEDADDAVGDFPSLPGMSEADELAMIDGFFTTIFDEDTATLKTWSPAQ